MHRLNQLVWVCCPPPPPPPPRIIWCSSDPSVLHLISSCASITEECWKTEECSAGHWSDLWCQHFAAQRLSVSADAQPLSALLRHPNCSLPGAWLRVCVINNPASNDREELSLSFNTCEILNDFLALIRFGFKYLFNLWLWKHRRNSCLATLFTFFTSFFT